MQLTSTPIGLLIAFAACGEAEPATDARAADAAATAFDAGLDAAADAFAPVADAAFDAEQPLLDFSRWHVFDAAADPLLSHQPTTIRCGIAGWYADKVTRTLDVETGACNYTLLEHPSLLDVAAGSTLHLHLYYFDLVAEVPAEAHLALLFGDDVVWETLVAIPAAANAIDVDFVTPKALAAGDAIRWHLHNHGQNSWVLTTLNARR